MPLTSIFSYPTDIICPFYTVCNDWDCAIKDKLTFADFFLFYFAGQTASENIVKLGACLLLKTCWEKMEIVVSSHFCFSNNVYYSLKGNSNQLVPVWFVIF